MAIKLDKGAPYALGRCCKGSATAAVITAALMALASLVLTRVDVSADAYGPISTLAASAGSWAASLISGKKYGEKGVVFGAAIGSLLFALVIAAGFAMGGSPLSEGAVYKLMALVASGAVGGFMGLGGRATARIRK